TSLSALLATDRRGGEDTERKHASHRPERAIRWRRDPPQPFCRCLHHRRSEGVHNRVSAPRSAERIGTAWDGLTSGPWTGTGPRRCEVPSAPHLEEVCLQ